MAQRGDEYKNRDKAYVWVWTVLAISTAILIGGMLLALPLGHLIGAGFSDETISVVGAFYMKVFQSPGFLIERYLAWWGGFTAGGEMTFANLLPLLPMMAFPTVLVFGLAMNPHSFLVTVHGSGRMAETADIKKMGLFDGFCIVVGRWNGKYLKLPETLSVLACAPPGTGKTVGIVIPTIFNSDGISLIVNDPKPELDKITSGYRQTVGPVFIVNWGGEDDPEAGLFWPRWNPLSPRCLPPPGPKRDMYVDSMVNVFVEEPKGGADPHWSKTGRNALSGFVHFVVSKCERALANDYFAARLQQGALDEQDYQILETYYLEMSHPDVLNAMDAVRNRQMTVDRYVPVGTWELIPAAWVGKEPCMAMILDWLMEAQIQAAADVKRRMEEGDQMAAMADPLRDVLDRAVDECRTYGYSNRAAIELNQLSGTPDKERGSILSTGLTGIGIFKNNAVRARTSSSDFAFEDVRGIKDPVSGEWKPITVYMSINQVDARALGVITGVFVELLSYFLIANKPKHVMDNGRACGPFPAMFVLDEFPQMPKLAAVKDGPAVGRGQKVSYLLIGQDLGQISGKYGKDDLETVISTTASKVILPQNNEQTAERFSKMIGNRTVMVESKSRTEGLSKNVNMFASNVSRSLQGKAVVSSSKLMSMQKGKQIVLMQGYMKYPIFCDSPLFFKDKTMLKKSKMKPAKPVPDWVLMQRSDWAKDTNLPDRGGAAMGGQAVAKNAD